MEGGEGGLVEAGGDAGLAVGVGGEAVVDEQIGDVGVVGGGRGEGGGGRGRGRGRGGQHRGKERGWKG